MKVISKKIFGEPAAVLFGTGCRLAGGASFLLVPVLLANGKLTAGALVFTRKGGRLSRELLPLDVFVTRHVAHDSLVKVFAEKLGVDDLTALGAVDEGDGGGHAVKPDVGGGKVDGSAA